jgi:hypothetical protein
MVPTGKFFRTWRSHASHRWCVFGPRREYKPVKKHQLVLRKAQYRKIKRWYLYVLSRFRESSVAVLLLERLLVTSGRPGRERASSQYSGKEQHSLRKSRMASLPYDRPSNGQNWREEICQICHFWKSEKKIGKVKAAKYYSSSRSFILFFFLSKIQRYHQLKNYE